MTRTLAALMIAALLTVPALADGTHANIAAWSPTDAIQANVKFVEPAEADTTRASVGMLWCTRSGLMPNLVASYELAEFAGWDLYADLFGAIDLSGGGAGISADAPDQFPVFDTIKGALNADRAGVGLYYSLEDHSVDLMLYTTF